MAIRKGQPVFPIFKSKECCCDCVCETGCNGSITQDIRRVENAQRKPKPEENF